MSSHKESHVNSWASVKSHALWAGMGAQRQPVIPGLAGAITGELNKQTWPVFRVREAVFIETGRPKTGAESQNGVARKYWYFWQGYWSVESCYSPRWSGLHFTYCSQSVLIVSLEMTSIVFCGQKAADTKKAKYRVESRVNYKFNSHRTLVTFINQILVFFILRRKIGTLHPSSEYQISSLSTTYVWLIYIKKVICKSFWMKFSCKTCALKIWKPSKQRLFLFFYLKNPFDRTSLGDFRLIENTGKTKLMVKRWYKQSYPHILEL